MKQTAVEWLLEEWPILESQIPPRIIDQAKAMEKEQIMKAHKDNAVVYEMDANGQAEQYYNETYNK